MADDDQFADQARRYRLDEPIATGGMGHVWRGTDTVLDRAVAIKLLKQEYADDAVFRSRFETEARHAAALRHPGVAQVFDFGAADGAAAPFLVMEYVAGQPLSALLRPGQPMDPDAASDLLAGAGDALGAAHAQGIVHRDVKPANLMVTDERRIKVTDFGIARAADGLALTRTGEVMGTPQYLSPEQAEGRPATPASDVYSLGVVAFECLTGQRPFIAESPVATALAHLRNPVPELPADVPPALAAVVRRAMAKDPAERYPDATAFAAAVREAADVHAAEPPDPTKAFTAPLPLATAPVAEPDSVPVGAEPVAARVAAFAETADAWREGARRVPAPVWAVAGVFCVVVLVAALTNHGGGDLSPAGVTSSPRPASSDTSPATTPTTSPPTTSVPTTPPPTTAGGPSKPPKPPKTPKTHGPKPGHGHKGKAHQ